MRKIFFIILICGLVQCVLAEEIEKKANPTLEYFASHIGLSLVVPSAVDKYFSKDALSSMLYESYKDNMHDFFDGRFDILLTIKNREFVVLCTITGFRPQNQVMLGIAPNIYPNIIGLASAQNLLRFINIWYLTSIRTIQSVDVNLFYEVAGMPVNYLLQLIKADYSTLSLHAIKDAQNPINVKLLYPIDIVIKGADPVVAIPFKGNAYALEQWRYLIDPPTSSMTGEKNNSAWAYDFFEVHY